MKNVNEIIKVNHPEYGHVIFSQMSARQMDILELFVKIENLHSKYPNDHDLGKEIRKLLNK